MPRKNRQPKHIPYQTPVGEQGKVRYPTRELAEKAADLRMLQVPNLELSVYQGVDGGWYLTSQKHDRV